ncbi:MAG: tetraacyldisaccharide 4'-kinase [Gammaproteobacteria bacterium]|nr:MAG: tetraacyldisaccharide 4'-kinase [Gammaproteobacteria bacterium]
MRAALEVFFNDMWYHGRYRFVMVLLYPFSLLYRAIVYLRRSAYALGLLDTQRLSVPVIVVGNLTVGGTGKTPLVIWIVDFLKKAGYSPCILSRGYKGMKTRFPQQVRPDSDPMTVGDEAILLAEHCQCPVGVSPDRAKSGFALLEHEKCDVIISDDGLQHYKMERDIEIAVVDGVRRFGNRQMLPAGPLREPVGRIGLVDMVVANGISDRHEFSMKIVEHNLRSVNDPSRQCEVSDMRGKTVHAVTGIGNAHRFFYHLKKLGMDVLEHEFPDHHPFTQDDIMFDDDHDVIMTEKDAVKCRYFSSDPHWYMPIDVELHDAFGIRLLALLKEAKADG